MERHLMHLEGKKQYYKDSILPKLIYKVRVIQIKIPAGF